MKNREHLGDLAPLVEKWAKRIILFLDKEQGIDRAKEEAKPKAWLEKRIP